MVVFMTFADYLSLWSPEELDVLSHSMLQSKITWGSEKREKERERVN